MKNQQEIKVKIARRDPEDKRSWMEEFTVPYFKGMTVLMALQKIRQNHPISFRESCAGGLCDICTMLVNGKKRLACKVVLNEPIDLLLEPVSNESVIRDLVTAKGSR